MTTLKEEEPYAAVVNDDYLSSTCSKCFRQEGTVSVSRCAACRLVYYCSRECQQADWKAHKSECKFLKRTKELPSDHVRIVSRMLCKAKEDPDFKAFNGRTYDSLLDHIEVFNKHEDFEKVFGTVCKDVQDFMGDKAPDRTTILKAIGKKRVNAYAIFDGTPATIKGVGLYIGFISLSIHDHSCDPDCFMVNSGPKLVLRTLKKDCKYQDELTVSYLSGGIPFDTAHRMGRLIAGYCFMCKCSECKNGELNNRRTSGRSSCCPDGWFAIYKPNCSSCGKQVSPEKVAELQNANDVLRTTLLQFQKNVDLYVPKGVTGELRELFESSKKICTDFNVNLLGLADLLFRVVFNSVCYRINNKMALGKEHEAEVRQVDELIDFCLPYVRTLPPSTFTVDFLARRFLASRHKHILSKELKEAAEEAFNATKLVYGENNETTLFLKPHVDNVVISYELEKKCNIK